MPLLTKPRAYQKHAVKIIDDFYGRALLADDMGLGKTFTSILWCWKNRDISTPIVVLCPAAVKYNWEREALVHFGLRGIVCEGRKPPSRPPLFQPNLIIINYEILQYWIDYIEDQICPQTLICDEVHMIKNEGAMRTKVSLRLAQSCEHVIALSGTPFENRPAELWTIINMLRPDKFRSKMKFLYHFCGPELTYFGWEFKGATNKRQLGRVLRKHCMIRRTKEQVLKDLPPITTTVNELQLAPSDMKEYRKAENDFIQWVKETYGSGRAAKAARSQKMTKLGYLKRLAAELKVKIIQQWITNFLEDTDEKLVVFGIHTKVIKPLYEKFRNHSALIVGTTSAKKRMVQVDSFQKDPSCRIFFGNIKAGGVGLNLTAGTHVAHTEIGWTPAEHNQGRDRIRRIGQTKPTNEYWLVARDTIELDLSRRLQTKSGVFNEIINDEEQSDTINIYDQIIGDIKKRRKIK